MLREYSRWRELAQYSVRNRYRPLYTFYLSTPMGNEVELSGVKTTLSKATAAKLSVDDTTVAKVDNLSIHSGVYPDNPVPTPTPWYPYGSGGTTIAYHNDPIKVKTLKKADDIFKSTVECSVGYSVMLTAIENASGKGLFGLPFPKTEQYSKNSVIMRYLKLQGYQIGEWRLLNDSTIAGIYVSWDGAEDRVVTYNSEKEADEAIDRIWIAK